MTASSNCPTGGASSTPTKAASYILRGRLNVGRFPFGSPSSLRPKHGRRAGENAPASVKEGSTPTMKSRRFSAPRQSNLAGHAFVRGKKAATERLFLACGSAAMKCGRRGKAARAAIRSWMTRSSGRMSLRLPRVPGNQRSASRTLLNNRDKRFFFGFSVSL